MERNTSYPTFMVPLRIHHKLPELQHLKRNNLLVGVSLTWVEFFGLLDGFELDPNVYVLRGSNGSRLDVNEQIGTYINSFKRKQKMYNVTLIRVASLNEQNEKVSNLIPNQSYSRSEWEGASTSAATRGQDTAPILRTNKEKMETLKPEKQSGRNTIPMKRLVHNILQSQHINQEHQLKTTLSNKRMQTGSESVVSRSDSFAYADPRISNDVAEQSGIPSTPNFPLVSRNASQKFRVDSRLESTEMPGTSTNAIKKRGRKPKQKPNLIFRNRRSKSKTDSKVDNSESEDDTNPSKPKKKLLKQRVLAYLRQKVSPRSFLRIQSELTELREKEKFSKVTSIVPMTATMLEQTFFRDTND